MALAVDGRSIMENPPAPRPRYCRPSPPRTHPRRSERTGRLTRIHGLAYSQVEQTRRGRVGEGLQRGRGEGGGMGGRGETEGGGIRGEWTTPCYQLGASRLPKPTNYYIPTIAILVPNQASYRTPVSLRVLCPRKDSPPLMMVHSMKGHRHGLRIFSYNCRLLFYSELLTPRRQPLLSDDRYIL